MTVLHLADAGEAADLAAFLARLLHYDRGAAVRIQAGGGVLAVFGRPPSFEVLAIRTARLAAPGGGGPEAASAGAAASGGADASREVVASGGADASREVAASGGAVASAGAGRAPVLDVTVSAGELLEGIAEAEGRLAVPAAVTGPPWAGVLPPRGGWTRVPGLPAPEALVRAVSAAVAEFRARDEALPPQRRTRSERDRIGREIWSRRLGDTELPLRAVHAAQALGFLRGARTAGVMAGAGAVSGAGGAGAGAGRGGGAGSGSDSRSGSGSGSAGASSLALLAASGWLRLSTPYGSVAVRAGGPTGLAGLSGLTVTPV
ncbi:hypothetical protein MUU72_34765 [Streptomyces sp. RS10V-4]|uniref:hypothetical protein n=1 Tax=Streptomyces rhizoryzae TaxID=2932493 RepID=UPI002002DA0C|nr:hypothetical protein [Streptomyces rhizoryzae]MCK7628189.1 hypothetical protein [Streptomyces rhizoryzae]